MSYSLLFRKLLEKLSKNICFGQIKKAQKKTQGLPEKAPYPMVGSKNTSTLEKTQGVTTLLLHRYTLNNRVLAYQ